MRTAVSVLLCAFAASSAEAQDHDHTRAFRLGARAIGLWSYGGPMLVGESRSELALTQPSVMGHAHLGGGRLELMAMLNLEGITLRDGELAAGNAGEGFIDRRHPHTYLHEAIVVGRPPVVVGITSSLAVGRGFAPFGTDDPMVRPFAKYPANHHLAQVLERWVVVAALRRGPFVLEAGLFNGDEPVGPDDLGRVERFADSWSLRATLLPASWLELQGSHASLESPEHALGGGLDQRKWSLAARAEKEAMGSDWYGLVEWGRTDEYSVGQRVFTFETALAEVSTTRARWQTALRFERTTRPEEERLGDPFRTARPHADENIIGITRWTSITARLGRELGGDAWMINPFAEVTHHAVRSTAGILFDPVEHYGNDRLWTLSLGARLRFGSQHDRMGRYGAALPAPPAIRSKRAAGMETHENGMQR